MRAFERGRTFAAAFETLHSGHRPATGDFLQRESCDLASAEAQDATALALAALPMAEQGQYSDLSEILSRLTHFHSRHGNLLKRRRSCDGFARRTGSALVHSTFADVLVIFATVFGSDLI